MTGPRWQRLEELVRAALEKEGTARAEYLRQACGDDADLLAEAESLLSFEPQAEVAIAGAVQGAAALFQAGQSGLAAGDRMGAYRIVREIGRGGMGTVYLAERDDDEFRKLVAIKLVTKGMDTAELLRRFRRERQILARLDHPYIARLLDGGSTLDGRPFLAMEYVQGIAITAYCDAGKLTTRQRIELFLKVCSAVQSAHQNLVVHRDLKPSNILVDTEGTPKLLDFGIAKLMGPGEGGDLTVALNSSPMLTPQYASPEQVLGGAIATSTDVYALGVILYELLAGVRPHDSPRATTSEILRAVCEDTPERPSVASRKNGRDGLKADELDNIILMALQKEPARRYGSVAEFANDLQRYLDGMPVKARKDTVTYRTRKFVRRHRTGVAAVVTLAATLVAGVAVSTMEALRAQRRFDEVRHMAHAVLYDIYDSIRDLPGSLKGREVVVKTALQYLDGLASETARDTDLQLELAEAYQRVGDVQGSALSSSLGQSAQAAISYSKAMKIADQLARRQPDSVRANLIRMTARESLGDISALHGDIEASLKLYTAGEEIGEVMFKQDPSNAQIAHSLADLYLASAREGQDIPRAIASGRKSVAMFEKLAAANPTSEELQADLAGSHSNLSSVLESANQFDEALDEEKKDVSIHEALLTAHPMSSHYRHDLMDTYEKLGDAESGATSAATSRPRDTAGALENYRKASALADTIVAADPADLVALEERGMAVMKLGMTIPAEKDLNGALTMLRRAQADFQAVATAQPRDARVLRRLAATHMYVGRRLAATGHTAEAEPGLREALRIIDGVTAKNPKDLIALNYAWRSSQELAKVLAAQQRRGEAIAFANKAISAAIAARSADGANPVTQSFLPQAWSNAGDVHASLATSPDASADQRRDDWQQARDAFQRSVDTWEQIQTQQAGPNNWADQLAHARAEVKRCAAAAAGIR